MAGLGGRSVDRSAGGLPPARPRDLQSAGAAGRLTGDRSVRPSGASPSTGRGTYGDASRYTHQDQIYEQGRQSYKYWESHPNSRPYYPGNNPCYNHYYPYCWNWGYCPSWWWGYYCGWWPGFSCYYWGGSWAFGFGFYWPYYYCYDRYWPPYYAYWYPYDYGYYWGYASYCPSRVVVYASYPSTVVIGDDGGAPAPPEDPMALGDLLLREGDYEGAAAAYRKVVEAEPDNSVAKFALADALFALGRYHEAAYMARKGLTQDPGWLDAEVDKARLFKDLAEFDRLLGMLQASASASAYDNAIWFLLGYQLFYAGRLDEARSALGTCLSLLPGDAIAALMVEKIDAKKASAAAPAEPTPESVEAEAPVEGEK